MSGEVVDIEEPEIIELSSGESSCEEDDVQYLLTVNVNSLPTKHDYKTIGKSKRKRQKELEKEMKPNKKKRKNTEIAQDTQLNAETTVPSNEWDSFNWEDGKLLCNVLVELQKYPEFKQFVELILIIISVEPFEKKSITGLWFSHLDSVEGKTYFESEEHLSAVLSKIGFDLTERGDWTRTPNHLRSKIPIYIKMLKQILILLEYKPPNEISDIEIKYKKDVDLAKEQYKNFQNKNVCIGEYKGLRMNLTHKPDQKGVIIGSSDGKIIFLEIKKNQFLLVDESE
jgi:hypothetical protein